VGDHEYILHLIPSGIIRQGKKCLLANGVVIDPEAFFGELKILRDKGIEIGSNLMVSQNAHVIMPYHRILDILRETTAKSRKIGTTGRGIGPCYMDKVGRLGIRIIDMIDAGHFREILKNNLDYKNKLLQNIYQHEGFELETVLREYLSMGQQIRQYIVDGTKVVNDALDQGQTVLFEGAQGTLLDVDFGTYPYVTSSNTGVSGVCSGAGIPPTKINKIIGVAKAYSTRVGAGPFPTELPADENQHLRELGYEYGATTGRPRRCGWFDLVSARYSVRLNGLTDLVIMKLDVLDTLPTIQLCTGYELNGKIIQDFPAREDILYNCKPVYEELPGWNQSTANVRKRADLPDNAKRYIDRIEKELNVPITCISVGSHRDQTILN